MLVHGCRWLYVAVAASVLFASCGEEPQPDVTSERATAVTFDAPGDDKGATTTLSINNFKVTAFVINSYGGRETLLYNRVATRVGLNRWDYGEPVDWPTSPVNFYAISPSSFIMNDEWTRMTVNYYPSAPGNGQAFVGSDVDLLVAVRKNVDQRNGRLRLNFRHALSQIKVNLCTTIADGQEVRVRMVAIEGRAEGQLALPEEDTPRDDFSSGSLDGHWTVWNNYSAPLTLFDAGEGSYVTLTDEPFDLVPDGKFLVPFDLWPMHSTGYVQGTRLEVMYQIVDAATGSVIWPDNHTQNIDLWRDDKSYGVARFSFRTSTPDGRWRAGKRYRYNVDIKGPYAFPVESRADNPPVMDVEVADI